MTSEKLTPSRRRNSRMRHAPYSTSAPEILRKLWPLLAVLTVGLVVLCAHSAGTWLFSS